MLGSRRSASLRWALPASILAALLGTGAGTSPQAQPTVQRTVLQRADLVGMAGREGVIVQVELPAGSMGYVYLPAGLALLPGSVLTARFGVRLNKSMDPRALKILFGIVFLLIGLRLFLGNIGGVLFPVA